MAPITATEFSLIEQAFKVRSSLVTTNVTIPIFLQAAMQSKNIYHSEDWDTVIAPQDRSVNYDSCIAWSRTVQGSNFWNKEHANNRNPYYQKPNPCTKKEFFCYGLSIFDYAAATLIEDPSKTEIVERIFSHIDPTPMIIENNKYYQVHDFKKLTEGILPPPANLRRYVFEDELQLYYQEYVLKPLEY